VHNATLARLTSRRRSTVLVTALALIGVFVAACGGSSGTSASSGKGGLGTLNVVTVVPNSLLFIGVQAAQQLGTWDGTGLKVNVINGTSPTAGQIMASGKADIGLMDGNKAAANIVQGLPAKILASCISPWSQYIIASSKSGATKVQDLKGGTFGTTGVGSAGDYSAYKTAQALGWSKDDYKATPLSNLEGLRAALKAGSIDAFAWSSTTAFNLEATGEGRVLTSTRDFVGPNVFEAFTVMNKVAKERADAVRVFFEGYYKAIAKIKANPQLAIDILTKDWQVNPVAAQKSVAADVPNLSTDGKISDAEQQGLADAVKFSIGKEPASPSSVYQYWQAP